MRKANMRLLSVFLCIAILLTVLPMSHAETAAAGDVAIKDVFTDKASYAPGDHAVITVQLENTASTIATELVTLTFYHLETCVATQSIPVSLDASTCTDINYTWVCPETDYTGYMVRASLSNGSFSRDRRKFRVIDRK